MGMGYIDNIIHGFKELTMGEGGFGRMTPPLKLILIASDYMDSQGPPTPVYAR